MAYTFFDGFGNQSRVDSRPEFAGAEKYRVDGNSVRHDNPAWNEQAEIARVKGQYQKAISQKTREKILSGFVYSGNGKRYATTIEDQLNWTAIKAGIDDQPDTIVTITAQKEPTPMTKAQFLAAFAEGEANKKAILASDVAMEQALALCDSFASLASFDDNR